MIVSVIEPRLDDARGDSSDPILRQNLTLMGYPADWYEQLIQK